LFHGAPQHGDAAQQNMNHGLKSRKLPEIGLRAHHNRRSSVMTDIVITAARRTAVGSFLGSFVGTPAHELGRTAIAAALESAGVAPEDVSDVILGQVLTAAQGQNPARQASMAAGIPKEIPAFGINQVCGSGLRAVALGAQAIIAGDARIVVAGGQENMSMSCHAQALRGGTKMGAVELMDQRRPDRRIQ
jgi:acetyl-CoA C-acetyltransferase